MLPELVQAVDEIGWSLPTDIQAEAIPLILGGGDVLMAAETGSGKTGAFRCVCISRCHVCSLSSFYGVSGKVSIKFSECIIIYIYNLCTKCTDAIYPAR